MMQNMSVAIQNSSFATQYNNHSVCTNFFQSKYFAMQKCWMKNGASYYRLKFAIMKNSVH